MNKKVCPIFHYGKNFICVIFLVCISFKPVLSQTISDINHVVHLGQSLGAGEHSLPIVTDSTTGFGNLSFKIGTHTWRKDYFPSKPELRASTDFIFVPLMAYERGHEGETVANGLCDHLKSTSSSLVKKTDFKFLFSFSGQGGRLIRELDKKHDDAKDPRAKERQSGGGYYKTAIDDVKRAQFRANLNKLSYSVFAITWMQGESNRSGFINRWSKPAEQDSFMKTYIEDFIGIKNNLQTDITAITKQQNKIPFFTYQTAGTTIGTAQLKACDMDSAMYMVGPTYMMPNGENAKIWHTQEHGDGIHLTADGERWLGEMFGKVMRKVVFEKEVWEPLRPKKAWYSEDKKHVLIKFHVPTPPLVLDSLLLPKQGSGFGFEIYDSLKTYEINKVSIVDKDLLEIELSTPILSASKLFVRYGLQSYVADISKTVQNVEFTGALLNKLRYSKIEFKGDITNEFKVIAQEGVFYLANKSPNKNELTDVLIRKVYLNEYGNTILLAETADWSNNIKFQTGQKCYMFRRFEYGNLRDSDNEVSIFYFKDQDYGNRTGQKYPLFNWSVAFQDLKID